MYSHSPILTPRLILRKMHADDAAGFFEMDSDPEVHRYLGNHPVRSIEEIEKVILYVQQQYADNGIGRWAVEHRETHEFLGWAGLKLITEPINGRVGYYDLGYRFAQRHWGKGYATEAAAATRDYAFQHMQLKEIFAIADVNNTGSNHVLQKTGFTLMEVFDLEGVAHNWYQMERPDAF